jgi:hypothetical protein
LKVGSESKKKKKRSLDLLKEEERLDLLKRSRREVEFRKDFKRRKGT